MRVNVFVCVCGLTRAHYFKTFHCVSDFLNMLILGLEDGTSLQADFPSCVQRTESSSPKRRKSSIQPGIENVGFALMLQSALSREIQ